MKDISYQFIGLFGAMTLVFTSACSSPGAVPTVDGDSASVERNREVGVDADVSDRSPLAEGKAMKPKKTNAESVSSEQAAVSGLPWAGQRSFARLDEYLVYLEKQSAIGKPHYDRIGPDLYVLVPGGGMTDPAPNEPITRTDLARKLGFSEGQY